MYVVHDFVPHPSNPPDLSRAPSKDISGAPEEVNGKASLPGDTVVHHTAMFTTCFRAGRTTVPPEVALIASGFGDASKNRWQHVRDLRFAKHYKPACNEPIIKNNMKDTMKRGWTTDEIEGWDKNAETSLNTFWELGEYEELRTKSVDTILAPFRAI
ncbi:hypothetical protein FRB96_001252 [Tulasnella sp. 330]|nr:hypothetical protein FRB96_001252 [Tulasnella sp. 330]